MESNSNTKWNSGDQRTADHKNMREQIIASPGTRRAAAAREFVQRPTRRERAAVRPDRARLRALLAYVPAVFKYVVVLAAVIALALGYRAAASASLFQVRAIDVTGTSRTSAEEIAAMTRRAVSRTGVWRADLSAISADLQRLPDVRRAVVTRVLPDGLRVRIIERVPVAVVRTSAGHFVWADEEGVMLGEMKAADHMPAFFIRGWNEEEGQDARQENAERVKRYQELTRAWDAAGLSERISEVNLIDVRDVRAQLAGNDSQIEVRLGSQDFGERLKDALDVLDEQKQTSRAALITYIDLTQGSADQKVNNNSQVRRAVIGLSTGGKMATDRGESEDLRVRQTADASQPSATAGFAAEKNAKGTGKQNRSNDDRKSSGNQKANNSTQARVRP